MENTNETDKYKDQLESIKKSASKINPNVITVLTGKNGSGKSLVRKIVGHYIAEKLGLPTDKPCAASVSMESRSQPKHDFSALKSMAIDDPTNPTGLSSISNVDMLVNNALQSERYLIIDEPEIGMGEELVAAMVEKLRSMFVPLPKNCLGVLIITHNRYIVQNLESEFLNLEGMTKDEWLNRVIVPTDIKTFEEDSLGLWRCIEKTISENKSKR